jgi:hypothetical protein
VAVVTFRADVIRGVRLAAILFAAILCGIAVYRIFTPLPGNARKAFTSPAPKDDPVATHDSDGSLRSSPSGLTATPASLRDPGLRDQGLATSSSRPTSTSAPAFPPPPPARTAPVHRTPYRPVITGPFNNRISNADPPPAPSLERTKPQMKQQEAMSVAAGGFSDNTDGDSARSETPTPGTPAGLSQPSGEDAAPAEAAATGTDTENRPTRWVKSVGHFFHIGARKYVPPQAAR